MKTLVADIVSDYQANIRRSVAKTYYKKDLVQGLLLVMKVVGVVKIMTLVGAAAVGLIGSLASVAAQNPAQAARIAKSIAESGIIVEVVDGASEAIERKYRQMGAVQKRQLRTVILMAAKGGLSWEDLM